MGYTTDFEGTVSVTPPLNPAEIAYLKEFADSRRHPRPEGPYSTREVDYQEMGRAYNHTQDGQPGLWCKWEPTDDGSGIEWNGAEKFYDSDEWMRYLIDHFLKPDAAAKGHPGFEAFTFDHVLSGTIEAQGEDREDMWDLVVTDNVVDVVPKVAAPAADAKTCPHCDHEL